MTIGEFIKWVNDMQVDQDIEMVTRDRDITSEADFLKTLYCQTGEQFVEKYDAVAGMYMADESNRCQDCKEVLVVS